MQKLFVRWKKQLSLSLSSEKHSFFQTKGEKEKINSFSDNKSAPKIIEFLQGKEKKLLVSHCHQLAKMGVNG